MKKTPRIRKDELAFGVETHEREKRRGDSPEHLAWIRKQPCVVTGFGPCDPHHLMRVEKGRGGCRGTGITNPDIFTLPLTRHVHDALPHNNHEREFLLDKAGISDPVTTALEYAKRSPDPGIRAYAKELLKR